MIIPSSSSTHEGMLIRDVRLPDENSANAFRISGHRVKQCYHNLVALTDSSVGAGSRAEATSMGLVNDVSFALWGRKFGRV